MRELWANLQRACHSRAEHTLRAALWLLTISHELQDWRILCPHYLQKKTHSENLKQRNSANRVHAHTRTTVHGSNHNSYSLHLGLTGHRLAVSGTCRWTDLEKWQLITLKWRWQLQFTTECRTNSFRSPETWRLTTDKYLKRSLMNDEARLTALKMFLSLYKVFFFPFLCLFGVWCMVYGGVWCKQPYVMANHWC